MSLTNLPGSGDTGRNVPAVPRGEGLPPFSEELPYSQTLSPSRHKTPKEPPLQEIPPRQTLWPWYTLVLVSVGTAIAAGIAAAAAIGVFTAATLRTDPPPMTDEIQGPVQVAPSAVAEIRWVLLEHEARNSVSIGDRIMMEATTPGHDDCTVQLVWRRANEEWTHQALLGVGEEHSLSLPIRLEMAPTFEYYLFASTCGSGRWPADGTSHSVRVH